MERESPGAPLRIASAHDEHDEDALAVIDELHSLEDAQELAHDAGLPFIAGELLPNLRERLRAHYTVSSPDPVAQIEATSHKQYASRGPPPG